MSFGSDFFSPDVFDRVIQSHATSLAEASKQLAARAGDTVRLSGSVFQASLLSVMFVLSATAGTSAALGSPSSGFVDSNASGPRSVLKSAPMPDDDFARALAKSIGDPTVLERASKALRSSLQRLDQKQALSDLEKWRSS